MKNPKLGASLLSVTPFLLKEQTEELLASGVDFLHIDIMDGNFVPNLAFNSSSYCGLRTSFPSIPYDIHFMTTAKALKAILSSFLDPAPHWITFHVELETAMEDLFALCRQYGVLPGLAVNPNTPIERLMEYLPFCRIVLLMSVAPGYGGQSFQSQSYERLRTLARRRQEQDLSFVIEVDGGITLAIAQELTLLGADMIVIGSDLIRQKDKKAYIHQFHHQAL